MGSLRSLRVNLDKQQCWGHVFTYRLAECYGAARNKRLHLNINIIDPSKIRDYSNPGITLEVTDNATGIIEDAQNRFLITIDYDNLICIIKVAKNYVFELRSINISIG
jgi:hypothetical protein